MDQPSVDTSPGRPTYEVAPPAEVLEPPELLWRQLRLRPQALLAAGQPVRSRVHDGKLEQVQRRP